MYKIDLRGLMESLSLGRVRGEESLSGGFLHKTFKVETDKGVFVVKALNPNILKREGVEGNIEKTECFAKEVSKEISAVPAMAINGKTVIQFKEQKYMIFKFFQGKSKFHEDISIEDVEEIGRILAKIHRIGSGVAGGESHHEEYLWRTFIQHESSRKEWRILLEKNLRLLDEITREYEEAQKILKKDVYSHRDLDPKNVLWNGNMAYIIDWEASGEINKMVDLMDTVFYWSENRDSSYNMKRFRALISGYLSSGGVINKNDVDSALASSFGGRLGWLNYNLKRACFEECSDERRAGEEEVVDTIRGIIKLQEEMTNFKEEITTII